MLLWMALGSQPRQRQPHLQPPQQPPQLQHPQPQKDPAGYHQLVVDTTGYHQLAMDLDGPHKFTVHTQKIDVEWHQQLFYPRVAADGVASVNRLPENMATENAPITKLSAATTANITTNNSN